MIGRLSQRKAVQRLSGVVSSPKLLARVTKVGQAAYSGTVPAGCFWVRCGATGRGLSGGYDEGYSFYPGAGGAYAYNELAVAPGQSVTITSTMEMDTVIKINGVIVCKGAGATTVPDSYSRVGGDPANCVGLYARRGGSYGGSGEAGGIGDGNSAGPGGDSDKVDGIGIWGRGGNPAGPGAGGPVYGTAYQYPPGPGAAVLEFWSGKR